MGSSRAVALGLVALVVLAAAGLMLIRPWDTPGDDAIDLAPDTSTDRDRANPALLHSIAPGERPALDGGSPTSRTESLGTQRSGSQADTGSGQKPHAPPRAPDEATPGGAQSDPMAVTRSRRTDPSRFVELASLEPKRNDWIQTKTMAMHPAGDRVVVRTNGGVSIWSLAEEKTVMRSPLQDAGWSSALAYSPDGKLIASGHAKHLVVFADATGKERFRRVAAVKNAAGVAFSADGKRVFATLGAGEIGVWDVATGKAAPRIECDEKPVLCLAARPGTSQLWVGLENGNVQVWNVPGEQGVRSRLYMEGEIRALTFSSDGSRLVVGTDRTVQLWNCRNWAEIRRWDAGVHEGNAVSIAPSGAYVAAATKLGAKVWSVADGTVSKEIAYPGKFVWCSLFTPNGERLVIGSSATGLHLFGVRD